MHGDRIGRESSGLIQFGLLHREDARTIQMQIKYFPSSGVSGEGVGAIRHHRIIDHPLPKVHKSKCEYCPRLEMSLVCGSIWTWLRIL